MHLQINDSYVRDRNEFVIDHNNNILIGLDEQFVNTHNIGEIILNTLNSKLDHVAQIDAATGKQTTFDEMRDLSVRCGLWLRKQGIGRGDLVTLCTPNHLEVYAPFLAVYYNGAIFNAWNHEITSKSARHFMQLLQPKVIFACESAVETLLEAAKLEDVNTKIIVFGNFPGIQSLHDITRQQFEQEVGEFRPHAVEDPRETALVILSSGSSGMPKGVMHSYGNILKMVQSFLPISMAQVALWYSTNYWISGFIFTLQSILSLGTRILHEFTKIEDTCKMIEEYKINRLFLMPIMITHLCKSQAYKKYNLDSVKFAKTGCNKINIKVFEEFKQIIPNAIVLQTYGMTETGRSVTKQTNFTKNPNSIGFPASCMQLKIVDPETRRALGPNEPGELCIKSPFIMLGYYKNQKATKEAFDNEGWLRSGDKVYYNEDGEIFFVDRLTEMIKYRHYQISPSEIEEILLSHPDVLEASVVAIPHEYDGNWPVAFVKKVPESKVTEDELVQLSSSTLGEVKKLRGGVKFLDNLPKTASGKIARPILKEMAKTLSNKEI
ncbi:luciferin 4-monooxygenase-like [Planococcus citri]|uniref:luciferin 4-monooxygenase-like n=1 Tax=Planococcus citri TaxID=170843 RepID=UPI0031F7F98F